jgi:3-oxoacyl-[acyl-carrier protein] reductase
MTALSRSIAGHVAIVTGAAAGMGKATALLFAQEGAHVAVTDRDVAAAASVVVEIATAGGSASAWALDVADADRIHAVVDEVAARWGGLDIIVNNAGIARMLPIDAPEYEAAWETLHSVLLRAQVRMVRAALPHLRHSAHPRVVNIASTEALGATSGNSVYAAAKAGVTGLTRALAMELGPDGITVNCICPGPILTEMTRRIPQDQRDAFAHRRTALRRYGRPEEVAHMTLSLCLPAASYVTGTTLAVDGGQSVRFA